MSALRRLFVPRQLAVIGGGPWCEAVITQAAKFGFAGDIWPVHPAKSHVAGHPAFRSIPDLPAPPDASFVGINRDATIGAVERLRRAGAGGAVCFASGFAEAQAEDASGGDAQLRLLRAADDMPILGPNCYGFINALDRTCVWPDQHGMTPVDRGVAVLTQSSNIAINLSFQDRGLPLAMLVTCGNMAQSSQARIARTLLEDDRITAIGIHVEGFTELPGWHAFAREADARDIPVIALKAGRSQAARAATVSHTASLAGEDSGAQALLDGLGIGRVDTLPEFLEALMLGHVCGRLPEATAASISCSGGEASLAADLGERHHVRFPDLTEPQTTELRSALGPKVALANPLDYHTYIWRDVTAMTAAWSAMVIPETGLTLTIVDFPDADRADPADWNCAIEAAIATKAATGAHIALVSTLPETLPVEIGKRLMDEGVAPLRGLSECFASIRALVRKAPVSDLWHGPPVDRTHVLFESESKSRLSDAGITVPRRTMASDIPKIGVLETLCFPVVAKNDGVAHKTEGGHVILNLRDAEAALNALRRLSPHGSEAFIEEMVPDGVVELLVSVIRDPSHGFILTLGAGGTLTELWDDTCHLLMPCSREAVDAALSSLKIAPLISGYRGKPGADRDAILTTIMALQAYVGQNRDRLVEVEINPLICTSDHAVAVDALIVETAATPSNVEDDQ